VRAELLTLAAEHPAARVDYVEFFDSNTLAAVEKVSHRTHLALAVFFGKTRLIDNGRL
jgi:pantoate--beta-alanine ligase